MRQIVLDTETTGLDPKVGHRVVEVAAIELCNRKITERRFHRYLNPERDIEEGDAKAVKRSSAAARSTRALSSTRGQTQ